MEELVQDLGLPSATSAIPVTTPTATASPAAHLVQWATSQTRKVNVSVRHARKDHSQRNPVPRDARSAQLASIRLLLEPVAASRALLVHSPTLLAPQSVSAALREPSLRVTLQTPALLALIVLQGRSVISKDPQTACCARPGSTPPPQSRRRAWIVRSARIPPPMAVAGAYRAKLGSLLAALVRIRRQAVT